MFGRFLPSRHFYLFGSDGWAALGDDAALILWLTHICKGRRLEC